MNVKNYTSTSLGQVFSFDRLRLGRVKFELDSVFRLSQSGKVSESLFHSPNVCAGQDGGDDWVG